ncbi:MAG: GNAT family protein [Candidatus Woesearchaeota archaeon]|jgi:hypothetical protein|nr:GNAT family protein [Candidatus Woesearchaeota archaeon]
MLKRLTKTEELDQVNNYLIDLNNEERLLHYFIGGRLDLETMPNSSEWSKMDRISKIDDRVIGYITVNIDRNSMRGDCFAFLSITERLNPILVSDTLKLIDDLFNHYGINKIEFNCSAKNPALKGYRTFIKRYGGREIGYGREVFKLMNGQYVDEVLFEVLSSEWKYTRRK